jgi:hypothetical protein
MGEIKACQKILNALKRNGYNTIGLYANKTPKEIRAISDKTAAEWLYGMTGNGKYMVENIDDKTVLIKQIDAETQILAI